MKAYKLRIPDSVVELVRGMHPLLKRRIKAVLKTILDRPEEGKELKDQLAGLRSFRVSRFRIIYKVGMNIVEIVAIGPRVRIYEETLRIIRNEERG